MRRCSQFVISNLAHTHAKRSTHLIFRTYSYQEVFAMSVCDYSRTHPYTRVAIFEQTLDIFLELLLLLLYHFVHVFSLTRRYK